MSLPVLSLNEKEAAAPGIQPLAVFIPLQLFEEVKE